MVVSAKSLVPEIRDAQKAWKKIHSISTEIYDRHQSITPSEMSRLMENLHKIKFVNNFLVPSADEALLMTRVQSLLVIVTPLHEQICNGNKPTEDDWNNLAVFLDENPV